MTPRFGDLYRYGGTGRTVFNVVKITGGPRKDQWQGIELEHRDRGIHDDGYHYAWDYELANPRLYERIDDAR